MKKDKYPVWLFWICIVFWIILAINPVSRFVWFLESIPSFVFAPLIIWGYKKKIFSNVSYTMIALFFIIHTIGAHYTYSNTPFLSEINGVKLQRDYFDRVAHFSFGLLIAFPLREIFMKLMSLKGFWSYQVPWSAVVSLSAMYELLEWGIASVTAPFYANAYLGIQGDQWDSQKDMLLADFGALIAMALTYFKSHKKRK